MRTVRTLILLLLLAVFPAVASASGTLAVVAHQDDDLLFMNPDIAADVQAGKNVTVLYTTAGDVPFIAARQLGDQEYVSLRQNGVRAAYAKALNVPNLWDWTPISVEGREIPANTLHGTRLRLAFMGLHAAAWSDQFGGDRCGEIHRLLTVPGHVSRSMDGRPGYTLDALVGTLRGLIRQTDPDVIRSMDTLGYRQARTDHIDHTTTAIVTALADTVNGATLVKRVEYLGYATETKFENLTPAQRDLKAVEWNTYRPFDTMANPDPWQSLMARQHPADGQTYLPGAPWTASTDVACTNTPAPAAAPAPAPSVATPAPAAPAPAAPVTPVPASPAGAAPAGEQGAAASVPSVSRGRGVRPARVPARPAGKLRPNRPVTSPGRTPRVVVPGRPARRAARPA